MKKKEQASVHNMTVEELRKAVGEARTKLTEFTVQKMTRQSKNVREGRFLRRKLAALLTVLREKEIVHE